MPETTVKKTHRGLTVVGLVLALAMSALEATVVATAMPTVTAELGGIQYYSWVTNAYLIMSAISVPIFGKLSDLYGRKPILLAGIFIFLFGSIASGAATTMPLLIVFRALQGLGAGAMQPMPLTIIGDIFDLKERAKLQGLFGASWGVFGLVGPLIGGVIVEHVSWRWVFYMNIPFGIACITIIMFGLHENLAKKKPRLDILGAFLLAVTVTFLLLTVGRIHEPKAWAWALATFACFATFVAVERRAEEPLFPLSMFQKRVISLAFLIGALNGGAMVGILTFVPLYIQGVLGGTPTQAGSSITPMLVAWPIASTVSGRLLAKYGFRPLVLAGTLFTVLAAILLPIAVTNSTFGLRAVSGIFGLGMGLANTAFVIAVQTSVTTEQRGIATAGTVFFRTIGGAVAVGVMGGVLVAALATDKTLPLDAASRALTREGISSLGPEIAGRVGALLSGGLNTVFWMITALGCVAFIAALWFPDLKRKT